ncbi:hypothetical protein G9A89_015192 [Geosiphon pyriformis]|nr:hypothetical protein G9A89_015192 [Geosiphon pyriformis]
MSKKCLSREGRDQADTDIDSKKYNREALFQNIGDVVSAAANDQGDTGKPTEIESYCMNCEKNGITRLLLTKIPHWREIVIMSFDCEHCGFNNNEVQFTGSIAEKGCIYTCEIFTKEDLNRQLLRSETACVKIPELDLELPSSNTQKGTLTTVEGLIARIIEDLSSGQSTRKFTDQDTHNKIERVLEQLEAFRNGTQNFTVSIDDPAGNSYIENLCAPHSDPKIKILHYNRTQEMEVALGYNNQNAPKEEDDENKTDVENEEIPEVMIFPANCYNCNTPTDTRMHVINIPHFREVVIMSTSCDSCGYKSNEVKAGGPISPQGKRITLLMEDMEDMSRDILKSETCGLSIPEINLELLPGTLGGRFTTVEGLLRQVCEELKARVPFAHGDSIQDERRAKFDKFIENLNNVISGSMLPVYLILNDPLANSYLQNPYAPDSDPNMVIETYKRTWEENESLGLNDMHVENYAAPDDLDKQAQM